MPNGDEFFLLLASCTTDCTEPSPRNLGLGINLTGTRDADICLTSNKYFLAT